MENSVGNLDFMPGKNSNDFRVHCTMKQTVVAIEISYYVTAMRGCFPKSQDFPNGKKNGKYVCRPYCYLLCSDPLLLQSGGKVFGELENRRKGQ